MMRDLPELLLLRHGETEWNRDGRLQGALDSPLTTRGRAQAAALGSLLRGLGVRPETHAALSSPQSRALETARIALEPLGMEPREEPGLVEIGMGLWSGLRRSEIEARWPGPRDEPILGFYARCPDGEGLEQVAVRARAVLEGIGRPTVIVTHGITRRVLCALALGRTLGEAEGIMVPQGSIARIRERCLEVLDIGAEGLPSAAASGSPPPMGG